MIMEVQAITKNVRMSAQKMREVVRQIQGLPAARRPGRPGRGAAQRARAWWPKPQVGDGQRRGPENPQGRICRLENGRICASSCAVAGTATTIKRFTPKARGSAGPILKRNCHVKIVLSDE